MRGLRFIDDVDGDLNRARWAKTGGRLLAQMQKSPVRYIDVTRREDSEQYSSLIFLRQ